MVRADPEPVAPRWRAQCQHRRKPRLGAHDEDPQGNAVTLNYDGTGRLASLTDATGRHTTFSYDSPGRPLLISKITDPFGRSAQLAYDDLGRLISITDVIGLVLSVTYSREGSESNFPRRFIQRRRGVLSYLGSSQLWPRARLAPSPRRATSPTFISAQGSRSRATTS